MSLKIQLKRGLSTSWATKNIVLDAGEMGIETDTNKFKIGDGTTAWNSLQYSNKTEWGSVEGTLANQTDLSARFLETDYDVKLMRDSLGTEETGVFPTELTSNRSSLSNGVIINRQHIAKTNCIVDKLVIPATCLGTNPVTTKVYIVEFNYDTNSYTKIDEADVTISTEENTLSKSLYVKKGQALGLWYQGGLKFGYTTKTPVATYPAYNVLLWTANAALPASGTASTITNPTQGFLLDWSFSYRAVDIPDFETEINDLDDRKVETVDFEPINEMFSEPRIESVNTGYPTSTNNLKGPGNMTWLIKNCKAVHTGYISALNINLGNASASAPTAATKFSIGSIKITPTDPEDASMVGTWECHDKLLDIDVPAYTENGLKVITLPRPLRIEAGDYVVIGGTSTSPAGKTILLQYNTPGAGSSALNRINAVFTNPDTMSGTFNGWQDPYNVTGISFTLDWIEYTDPFSYIEETTARVDKLEDDTTWLLDEHNVFTKIFPASPSPCSPNNAFWIDLRDQVTGDGYIHTITLAKNTSETSLTAAIAAFNVTGSVADNTQRAEIMNIKQFTLPAGALTYSFPKTDLFAVHAGEHVAVCVPGQMYYGGSGTTNNIVNGGSINSKVGDVLTGRYTGSLQMCQMFTWCLAKDAQGKLEQVDENITALDERTSDLVTSTSYNDLTSVMLVGSSLTEAGYTPTYTTWPERLSDETDITIYNNGYSGRNIYTNLNRINNHEDIRFAPGNIGGESRCKAFDLHPTYFLWNDCANSSPYGYTALELYKKVKDAVESYGSKLLLGSEENYAGQYNAYEHTQQSFSREAGVPYSPITRIQQKCYPRNNPTVCPYPVNGSSHAGYRANVPYLVHKDLIGVLPIYKNIKIFRPRTTYKGGNPTIDDLRYDNIFQRLKYWTSMHPGQGGNNKPGHIDNLDNNATGVDNDVPNTTHVNPYGSRTEPADLYQGSDLYFDKWALLEIITENIEATKGTFEVYSNVEPTKVYIANLKKHMIKPTGNNKEYTAGDIIIKGDTDGTYWVALEDFTSPATWSDTDEHIQKINFDDYVYTEFEELAFTYADGKVTASFEDNTSEKAYQVYDKFRLVIYYADGQFRLSKPRLYNYNGKKKLFDETIPFHQRKFGEELFAETNPTDTSAWYVYTGTGAAVKELDAPVANYTLYNNTLKHVQLNNEGANITKTIALGANAGYKRVAVRIVAQIWNKISTIRYIGTEWENSEYITSTKDDPLGVAAYVNSDYDYGIIKVKLGQYITKRLLVYPGWNELYFEADLTPDDTSVNLNIMKESFVDDSYNNDDKPIFIHHVSVQDITDK